MEVLCGLSEVVRLWFDMRPGGPTRGKWRIPDGKVGERFVIIYEAPKVVAPTCDD
jgi:hypothetical protein